MDSLEKWNHNSLGNPHNQYTVNNSDISIRPFNFDSEKCWFKLLTFYLPDIKKESSGFGQFEIVFDVYDVSNYGGYKTDNHSEIFLKAGTANKDIYKETGNSIKFIGENRRCILTCTSEIVEEDDRVSYVDDTGFIHHDINKKRRYRYRYDLYVKMKTDIYQRTYFVKKFISSYNVEYRVYNMTYCNTLDDLNLKNTIHYISTNYEPLIIDDNFYQNNYYYIKLFDLDLSVYRSSYINYNGVFEITASYSFENRTLDIGSSQYIKLIVTAVNSDCDNNINGKSNVHMILVESSNYRDNIVYNYNDDNTVSVWFKSSIPCRVTLYRKDIDLETNIFKLDIVESLPKSICGNEITLK